MSNKKRKNRKNNVQETKVEKPVIKKELTPEEKSVRRMRILLISLIVFAVIMALIVFIPSTGSLTSELTGTDFNGDGDAMRVRVDINNDTNKPAFNVQYTIVVKATDGTVLGTTTRTILMMLPGGTRHVEEYLYFDTKVDQGDVEVDVTGWVVGE
jgi:hypothetical protein